METVERPPWIAVTGAGSGLGREIAWAFARRGFRLELAGRRLSQLEATLRNSSSAGGVEVVDVRDEKAVRTWATERVDRLGPPSVVVPAAGVGAISQASETSAAALSDLLAVNLVGVSSTVQAFLPSFREAGRGLIVALLSVAARRSFPGWSAYCASKAGLAAYLQAVRHELVGSGVRILEVYPGATDTPIWDDLPGHWNRQAMMRADQAAEAIVTCALSGPSVAVEELHLGPPGGPLAG